MSSFTLGLDLISSSMRLRFCATVSTWTGAGVGACSFPTFFLAGTAVLEFIYNYFISI